MENNFMKEIVQKKELIKARKIFLNIDQLLFGLLKDLYNILKLENTLENY